MSNHSHIFDIETGPLPASYLDMICPEFEAPSNYKDPLKIAANIAEQKVKWLDRAALSPLTGKVLAIGIMDGNGEFTVMDGEGDEARLLLDFTIYTTEHHHEQFVGFNIFNFDIPFLMRRAWKLGVKPCFRHDTNLHRLHEWVDLREVWQCGDRSENISLDTLAKYLGVGSKSGSGKDFAKLWAEDRPAAEKYLHNDLMLTKQVAVQMGVIV